PRLHPQRSDPLDPRARARGRLHGRWLVRCPLRREGWREVDPGGDGGRDGDPRRQPARAVLTRDGSLIMDLSVTELALATVAVLIGACIQGSLGFGLGLVAAPVLVMLDTSLVPSVVLGIGVPLT